MHPTYSVIFFLPLVAAVSNLAISQNPTSGGPCTITWTADTTDPSTISFELVNVAFHNSYAIANNIAVNAQTLSVTLPAVPVIDGYTIEAVQISNINNVLGTSGSFAIGATASTSTSSVSTASISSTTSATSPTTTATTTTSTSSSLTSSSGSTPSASATSFNGNGAQGSHLDGGNVGSIAAVVIGIVAGAVFV